MHPATADDYGPGTIVDQSFTPEPQECKRLLKWLAGITPGSTEDPEVLDNVHFEGDNFPSHTRPSEVCRDDSCPSCYGRYRWPGICDMRAQKTGQITINTDHVGLWLGTPILVTLEGKSAGELTGNINKIVPLSDKGCFDTPLHYRKWAICETKTPNTWYQIHSSLTPGRVFKALSINPEGPGITTRDEAFAHIQEAVAKLSAMELEMTFRDKGLCGVTCFTPQAWRETVMGDTLARHPLISYGKQIYVPSTPPAPFSKTTDKRPLAGMKVVELARVIAAPALCARLASLGADVVRVISPHAPDVTALQLTLIIGKRECSLDLETEKDRARLHRLLEEADVVIQGYRKGSLERKGFSLSNVLEMACRRGKGVIYIDENCFGPDGIYAEVPGWQQISDAAPGSCYVMGKAYGFAEGTGILPSLPIADLSIGAVGIVTTMMVIRDRAKYRGSYHGSVALTAYNAISLLPGVGLYQPKIVKKLQERYQWAPMTP